MCYSTNDKVNLTAEVTFDKSLPYGTNGYRSDCNNIPVSVLCTSLILACREINHRDINHRGVEEEGGRDSDAKGQECSS